MKRADAWRFFGLGVAMLLLPAAVPELCPRNGVDGTSARELWLYVMGAVNVIIGSGGVALCLADAVMELFETVPQATRETVTVAAQAWREAVLTQTESLAASLEEQVESVDFSREAKSEWNERRAA